MSRPVCADCQEEGRDGCYLCGELRPDSPAPYDEHRCMQWDREECGGYCCEPATHSAPHPDGGRVWRCAAHAATWDESMREQGGEQLSRLMRAEET